MATAAEKQVEQEMSRIVLKVVIINRLLFLYIFLMLIDDPGFYRGFFLGPVKWGMK